MTAAERQSLLVVIRGRERVAIAAAREYKAVLIANFERKLATIYKPEDHPVWAQAHAGVAKLGREMQARVAATFHQLGIPVDWAPSISVSWYGRGENAALARRAELRHVAQSEAEKRLKAAEATIKRRSVEAQERVITAGLTSEAARVLLDNMPTPDQLMPELEIEALEQIAAPDRGRASPRL